jgi:ATP-dependent RNA helicase DeaD
MEAALRRPMAPADLYAVHMLGTTGARRFLTELAARPDRRAADVVGEDAVARNRSVFQARNGRAYSLREVHQAMEDSIGQGRVAVAALAARAAPFQEVAEARAVLAGPLNGRRAGQPSPAPCSTAPARRATPRGPPPFQSRPPMPFPPLPPPLAAALDARGYAEPTPVQATVLEEGKAGRDLLVSAQTGSGKTVAFGLAFAPELLGEAPRIGPAGAPLALAIAPTRELALQVRTELAWLYAETGARVVACVGGTDIRAERRLLDAGAHIVVGTPGRLRDHLERGGLQLGALRAVVLDEADEMLDMGFRDELEAILDATPAERRTLMFSATIPREIAALATRYQRDALRIAASTEGGGHRDIEHLAMAVAPRDAERALVNLLRWHDQRAIVFCATRAAVARLHGNLTERGFNAVALSGELTQAERNRALQSLRDGRAQVCVATDVAARGIDLPDLGLVVHAELPRDRETLTHRSGRTGRAGRKGISVLLVPYTRRRIAERLLAAARVQARWVPPPSAEEIRQRDGERAVKEALAAAETAATEPEVLALGRAVLATEGASAEAVAAALVRLLGAARPAPEELEPNEPEPRMRPPRREDAPGDGGAGVWFRLGVGRNRNADPRWLLPFICRSGHVTRQEVGRIEVMERETRVEIAPWAAARFADAVARNRDDDEDIPIEPLGAPPAAARQAAREPGRAPARAPAGPSRPPVRPASRPARPSAGGDAPLRRAKRPPR